MGTRAVYTFIDADERHSIYKHWDGYPTWACRFIERSLPKSLSSPVRPRLRLLEMKSISINAWIHAESPVEGAAKRVVTVKAN